MISIKVTGKNGLSNLSVPQAIVRWETVIVPEILAEMRRQAPVGNEAGAGRLRDSIKANRRTIGGGIEARFTANVPYAKFVESGTKAHRIEAREARVLHWSQGGSNGFARFVNHPGTKPNKFAEKSINRLMPWIKKQLSTSFEKGLKP